MNIFAVDENPYTAAHSLCDKHVVKMIVETAQMLSTAHRVLDGKETIRVTASNRKIKHWVHPDSEMNSVLCLPAMVNHPCTVWSMKTDSNYFWLWDHGMGLLTEYTKRYSKVHSMQELFGHYLITAPEKIPSGKLTPFAQAMPQKYQCDNSVLAYRRYYINEKKRFAKWKNSDIPVWFNDKSLETIDAQ